MLTAPCYVISDVHIGFAPREVERACVAFLRSLPGRAGSLLINGDLFEFWFEWRTVVQRASLRVIAALIELQEAGVPVMLIAGNHDCWGGDVLREEAGVEYHVGPWEGELGGWRARVEHGDGLRGKEDRGYRFIRPILRNRAAIRAYRLLPPDLANRLANGSSNTSRNYSPRDGGEGLRRVAGETLAARPELELVLYGHSHVAALERTSAGGVYANAGSWLDAPTYLVATPERIELRRWDGSAEGTRLHLLDRRPEKALR